MTYIIRDCHTKLTLKRTYATGKAARRSAERMNMAYGAHRYSALPANWATV
jgi:hypothetical protein